MDKAIGNPVFYFLAILIVSVPQIYLFYIFREYIISGYGVGIYGIFLYLISVVIGSCFWLLSYRASRDKVKACIYWAVALAFVPIIVFQPTWWAAPVVN